MHLFRLTFVATPAQGATPDDLLAPVMAQADRLTIVDAASAVPMGRSGLVDVQVDYWGLNAAEAARTAEESVCHATLGTAALMFDLPRVVAL